MPSRVAILTGWATRRNPACPSCESFKDFLDTVCDGKPFCFWFRSHDPRRPYENGRGAAASLDLNDVKMLPDLPDTP